MASILDFLNLYSFLACAIALLWYHSRSYRHWKKLKVKFLNPVPFFGNMAAFVLQLKSFQQSIDELYTALQDEPFGGIYLMRYPLLIVKDPKLISAILVKDFKNFDIRNSSIFFSKNRKLNPLHMNLFAAEGERWRTLRHKMRPFFSSAMLRQMYDQVTHCVDLLVGRIDADLDRAKSVDLCAKELIDRLAIDVIGSCAFGVECDSLGSNDKFSQMCSKVFQPSWASGLRLVASIFGERAVAWLKLGNLKPEVNDFFVKLALDTIQYRRANGVVRNDMLQLLMSLQNSHVDEKFAVPNINKVLKSTQVLQSEEFDEVDIAANLFLFFTAGYDTISLTLSFCLYELALNQEIQERLRLEVQQVQDKYKARSYDSLKEMTYMDAVIAETLRKYPPGVNINPICSEDYVIPGTKIQIPAGARIIVPVWSIHHDGRYFSNPEIFDPERFIGENNQTRPSGVYLPFGDGPRYCIGKRFADMELRAALSQLLLKYQIKPCDKTQIPLTFKGGSVYMNTKYGIWISLSRKQ